MRMMLAKEFSQKGKQN